MSAAGQIDLGALSTRFARITPEAARDAAQALYGLSGDLHRLDTEKDDTFRLDAGAQSYILKIANPGESAAELDLQAEVLRHLERRAPDLPVPRILPARNGALVPELADASGLRRVRLMSYLPGTVLDTVTPTAAERHEIGRLLGRLRLALADFRHPGARRMLAWDVRHLDALSPLLAQVDDAGHRAMLEAGLIRYRALLPRIHALPRQVVHNDFSRSNLLVARPGGVCGIIDFGDVVETAIAIDVSTALLNQLPRDAAETPVEDLLAEAKQLLAGYLEVAPLSTEERALLPHLVMGRIITRALLSLWRAREFPDNSRYILRNTDQGWAQLAWFLARTPEQISTLLP